MKFKQYQNTDPTEPNFTTTGYRIKCWSNPELMHELVAGDEDRARTFVRRCVALREEHGDAPIHVSPDLFHMLTEHLSGDAILPAVRYQLVCDPFLEPNTADVIW